MASAARPAWAESLGARGRRAVAAEEVVCYHLIAVSANLRAPVVKALDQAEVRDFLLRFKSALAAGDFHFVRREKNIQALLDLGMSMYDVRKVLQALRPADYVSGPLPDNNGRNKQWWIFGPSYGNTTLYVKIGINSRGQAECLSFHSAELDVDYPLKERRDDV